MSECEWQTLVEFVETLAFDFSRDLQLSPDESDEMRRNLFEASQELRVRSVSTEDQIKLPPKPLDTLLQLQPAVNSKWSFVWKSKAMRDAIEFAWNSRLNPDVALLEAPEESLKSLRDAIAEDDSLWVIEWRRSETRDTVAFRKKTTGSCPTKGSSNDAASKGIGFLLDHPRSSNQHPTSFSREKSDCITTTRVMMGNEALALFTRRPSLQQFKNHVSRASLCP